MNLSHKFVLVLLSMIIVIVSLFTYLNIKDDENTFNLQLENRVVFMKKQILQNAKDTITYHIHEIENDIASMNLSHISVILKQLNEREEIEGTALISKTKEMQLFEGRPYHRMVTQETIEENPNHILISVPVVFSEYWGTFLIVYSLDTLNKEIENARRINTNQMNNNIKNAMLLALIIFVIFSLLVVFWARKLIYPILLLTKSAQTMSRGELHKDEALLNVDRNDEVGILIKTFQEMRQKLEDSYKKLQHMNESLEEKIRERTKDLEKSKDNLKHLASIDPMTQLYNRRYFSEISEEMFTVNKKEHKSVALIMIDIDNFKNVNDTYGHHIGDKVIIAIANILLENTRKNDIVCRYGGEEYMILLPETDMTRCVEIAEKIRILSEQMIIELEKKRELKVTISIGISMADMLVDNNIEIAINKADNALYEAKRGGKNRIVEYGNNNFIL